MLYDYRKHLLTLTFFRMFLFIDAYALHTPLTKTFFIEAL